METDSGADEIPRPMGKIRTGADRPDTVLSSQESFQVTSGRRSSSPPIPPNSSGVQPQPTASHPAAPPSSSRLRAMGGSERLRKTPSPYLSRLSPGGAANTPTSPAGPPLPGVTVTTPTHSQSASAAAASLKPVTSVHWRTPGEDNDSSSNDKPTV